MDTTAWGPPGWLFQNYLCAGYTPSHTRNEYMLQYYSLLPYALPCKYCRTSLTQYIDELPLTEEILNNKELLLHWLYDIHNKVNDKLRGQGLLKTQNPSFAEARQYMIETTTHVRESGAQIPGWDFLYCIAYNMPTMGQQTDMEYAAHCIDDEKHMRQLNINNSVPYSVKVDKLRDFFSILPLVLPSADAGYRWIGRAAELDLDDALESSQSMMEWLYEIQKAVELETGVAESFNTLFGRIASYASKCNSKRAQTCRKSMDGGAVRRRATRKRRNG